jgi:hypothetical protein
MCEKLKTHDYGMESTTKKIYIAYDCFLVVADRGIRSIDSL